MEKKAPVPKHLMMPSVLLILIVHTNQIGVGLITFTRYVFQHAKQDAWLSVIIAGFAVHMVLFLVHRTLMRFKDKDLFDIHTMVFGKWIGNSLNALFIMYMFGYSLTFLLNYFAFISGYLFPEIPIWLTTLFMLVLVVYTVSGGIRVVVGISVLSFLLTIWLVFVPLQSFAYANFRHFFPLLENSPGQILKGAYEMSYCLTGFEILFFLYPYINEKEKAGFYAQIGTVLSNSMYLFLMILTIGLYSAHDLIKTVWPTLDLFKVVSFPFLEQFEVVVIMLTMIIILPNMGFSFWVVSKGLKHIAHVKQIKALYTIAAAAFVIVNAFQTYPEISQYTEMFNQLGFAVTIVYPILLFGVSFLTEHWRKRRSA